MLQIPGDVELCRTDLKGKVSSPADWKELSLGINDTGSSTDFLTQYLGTKNNVNAATTTEVAWVLVKVGRGPGGAFTPVRTLLGRGPECGHNLDHRNARLLRHPKGAACERPKT
jgi:hypothetical protein